MGENFDEFNIEWSAIHQKFSFKPFLCNTFPMKITVNLSKFCSSNFIHAPFIKILPHRTFVPNGISCMVVSCVIIQPHMPSLNEDRFSTQVVIMLI